MAICRICGEPVTSGVVVHTECLGDNPDEMHGLVRQLRRLSIERRPEACLGCGYEHGCSVHGCAVIKRAAEMLDGMEVERVGNELKPCPFCGNEFPLIVEHYGGYNIECPNCQARFSADCTSGHDMPKEWTIKAWNRRAD